MAINEQEEEIVFLHRILPGSIGRSYGIQVARLAGMPSSIIQRAREVLAQIEQQAKAPGKAESPTRLALVAESGAAYQVDEALESTAAKASAPANNHHAPASVLLDNSADDSRGPTKRRILDENYAVRPPGPTRVTSPRQLPTDHVPAVPTRVYQCDQSSR